MDSSTGNLLEEEEGVDIRKWFFLILDNWLLFLVFGFVAVSGAFIYNVLAEREYSLSTKVLIKEDANPLDKGDIVRLTLRNDPYKLENEVGLIRSSFLRNQTLKQLNFYTEYYEEKNFQTLELYKTSPFVVYFDKFHVQPVNVRFDLKYLNDSVVRIEVSDTDVQLYDYKEFKAEDEISELRIVDTVSWGDTVENNYMKFSVWPRKLIGAEEKEKSYYFQFQSLLHLSRRYSNIDINIPKNSSILSIGLKHNSPLKAVDYLNTFVENYLNRGIEREVRVAELTINFIDAQLSTIIDSLQVSEQKLENFRSENQLVDIDYQAQQVYSRQTELEQQKAELIIQRKYLEYLTANLKTEVFAPENLVAPSTMGISDPVLNNLILELVEQYHERTQLKLNTKRDNPYISSLDAHIVSTKNKLYETVNNLLRSTLVSLEEIDVQIALLMARLSELPKNQRELFSFQRNFELNDELYTYLLTRRSEMQIKKASILPINELLEEATVEEALLTHPNKKVNYIIAVLLGLLVPFGFLYIKVSFNHKIESHEELKQITKDPLMGAVYQNVNTKLPVVTNAPQSVVSESFRMLRANLQFVIAETSVPVIAISSAMKGEGKSYVAINTAAVYASYGKKVCLVDLDLRRPRLANYLNVENEIGMSNLLIGQKSGKDIVHTLDDARFDLYPSGPMPPNPSELVSSDNLVKFIEKLKKSYDIIILDTPPIGIVSDALNISELATSLLLVVRHKVTVMPMLVSLLDDLERNKVKGVCLVYNDVPVGKGYYRYGYRYGYHYEDTKKGFFSRLFGG